MDLVGIRTLGYVVRAVAARAAVATAVAARAVGYTQGVHNVNQLSRSPRELTEPVEVRGEAVNPHAFRRP